MKKISITSNILKIIGITCMIFDHIGYYFFENIDIQVFYMFRIIGRIAMPIFTFLLVQGFFHTKNLKKYLLKIFGMAVFTQLILFILQFMFNRYTNLKYIDLVSCLNILFSFSLILLVLKSFSNLVKNKLNFILIIFIFLLYFFINFDYSFRVLILGICFYFCEMYKLRYKNKYIYKILIFISILLICIDKNILSYFSILSCIPIFLYNGKLGNKSKKLKNIFYLSFPINHIVIGLISIILNQVGEL